MDVLDDLEGAAAEVHEAQPWLTYGAPLHRLREWGTSNKLFDLLDERPLAQHELPGFASLILGEAACDGLPHPSLDWAGFLKALDKAQASAKPGGDSSPCVVPILQKPGALRNGTIAQSPVKLPTPPS